MSDQFGRQKSTRWQKPAPAYDWDNEYGYDDYEDEEQDKPQPQKFELPEDMPPLPGLNVYSEKKKKEEKDKKENETIAKESGKDFVLSVDRLNHTSYDSSDEEETHSKEVVQDIVQNIASPVEAVTVNTQQAPVDTIEQISPEKKSLSSESFNFDGLRKQLSSIDTQTANQLQQMEEQVITETILDNNFRKQLYQPPDTPMSDTSFQSDYSFQKEPVELTIKGRNQEETYPDKSMFEKSQIPPEPEPFILSIDQQTFDSTDDEDDDWGYNSQHSSNLESDLEHEHKQKQERTLEPEPVELPVKTISHLDQYQPEGEADSIDKLIKDIRAETIEKLDEDQSKRNSTLGMYAQNINYSDENQSPIRPLSTNKLEHDEYLNSLTTRKPSVRKPPNQVDSQLPKPETPPVSEDIEETAQENEAESLNLHSVASTASLSTGKLSVEHDKESIEDIIKPPSLDAPKRQVSTRSNATFNLGGWAPPTDNFRNQFINFQDNDSIKEQDEEDQHIDSTSLVSVPETIDASLPKVDDSDEENDQPDVYSPSPPTIDNQSISQTINTVDSVLKDNQYYKPIFKEERLTPGASTENLKSATTEGHKRNMSDISEIFSKTGSKRTSIQSTETTSDFKPGKYPVYDWKKITTISRPTEKINAYKDAQIKEFEYDTGLQNWLVITLKQVDPDSNIHIGKMASNVYQNAPHSEIKRHGTILSKVSIVKDTGTHASNFGKKLFSKSKKFIRSTSEAK